MAQLFDAQKGINIVGCAQLFDIIKLMLYYIKYVGLAQLFIISLLEIL